ncbi:MAG: AAA family ATPase [Devosia sp.]|uniref:AAA family ATPase n=1 Tax=Devosia sp. TaxID=1871048 RepID=UPI0033930209
MTKLTNSISLALWGKGGSGKSTTALALASLAAAEGRRAVVLDADPQRSSSAWYQSSKTPSFAVHSTEVVAVPALLERAKARYDLVIIDNPPARYSGSSQIVQSADLSLIVARPYAFDLTLALEWVGIVQRAGAEPLVALTAAPPERQGIMAPAVKAARARLTQSGALVWSHQVTQRQIHPELIAGGMSLADLPETAFAREDYERLWLSLCRWEGCHG